MTDARFTYTRTTKLSNADDQVLIEYANKLTNGNLSGMLRKCVEYFIENYPKNDKDSPWLELAKREWKQQNREKHEKILYRFHLEYLESGDPSLLKIIEDAAKERHIPYPPEKAFEMWELDEDLVRTLNAIEHLSRDGNVVSFRDLCRTIHCDKEKAVEFCKELEGYGKVFMNGEGKWMNVELRDF